MTKARDISKLSAVEVNATADQTDAEVKAAVEAASDSNTFTDADHSKLNAIEASADVTDATNVTAAGALMDSELTNLAAVKAINQSLVTTASPTFSAVTTTGNVGIGTSSPNSAADLHVADTSDARIWLEATSGDTMELYAGTNVSLFNRSNNALTFGTNNAERMRIDSSGRVGIGITSPTEKFTVVNSSSGIVGRFTNNTNQTLDLGVISGSGTAGGVYYNSANAGYHAFQVGGTEYMRIDSSGNVGIGTTSPSDRLVVQKDSSNIEPILVIKNDNTTDDNGVSIDFAGKDTGSNNITYGRIATKYTNHATEKSHMIFSHRNDSGAFDEWMRVTHDGNVGIGTASPDNPLEVVGADSGIKISSASSNRPHLRFECGSDEKLRLSANGAYGAIGDGSDANRYMILKDGKVGINDEPTDLFYITGNATSTAMGIKIGTNGYNGIEFDNATGSLVGRITINSGTTAYVTSSDYRLKENVTDMTGATTRLKQLKPKRFNWIADNTNTLIDGFLAHEVSSIVPEAVAGEKDAVHPDGHHEAGEIDPQGIDHSKLVPLLVKTIQELEARITALEA